MNERERSDQTGGPRRGKTRTSIHLVLNWTHMSVFVAVAALGLITLNQGFAGIDQRFDDTNQRFDDTNQRFDSLDSRLGRIEGKLDRVEDELSDINARLSVVEFIGRAGAGTEAESPTTAGASVPDC